jgi:hypothetical protein
MVVAALCVLASPAVAQSFSTPAPASPVGVSFLTNPDGMAPAATVVAPPRLPGVTFMMKIDRSQLGGLEEVQVATPRPRAIVYSDAYRLRAKIHKYASFATLPLFVTEALVGQSLYQNPTSGKKDAHLAVATGMGVLFGVNTVTGVWNLIDARKDPHGRTRRWLHGVLLLGADAGFLAAAATAPDSEFGERGGGQPGGTRSLHRAMAFTSIGLASVGYLIMLFGGR